MACIINDWQAVFFPQAVECRYVAELPKQCVGMMATVFLLILFSTSIGQRFVVSFSIFAKTISFPEAMMALVVAAKVKGVEIISPFLK